MSSLIVEVCEVAEIAKHPNADRLEKVRVKNWWCLSTIGHYKVGDKCVYIPPDAIISNSLAEKWNVTKFLAPLPKNPDGSRPDGLRVRAVKFRGERSYGMIQDLDDPTWEVGKDLIEHYNIFKYEPPVKSHAGDAAADYEPFHKYTDIENFGNFPDVFQDGEEVVIDEKIHGTNCRFGIVPMPDDTGLNQQTFMGGSHTVRRKQFDPKGNESLYWFPIHVSGVVQLLNYCYDISKGQPVILFGEIYGPGIQDMHYGLEAKGFRAFDMTIGGKWLDYDEKTALWSKFGVEAVPVIYRGPFSLAKCEELVDGPTTVCETSKIREVFKGREGIVIRPVKERFDSSLCGRAILKYVSVDYHERKNKDRSEDH